MTERWNLSPLQAALVYATLGTVGLFVSDVVLVVLVDDRALLSQIQATKGWIEVLLTTVFIYVVMRQSEASLSESLAYSRERGQELAVLHRVFRHDLRNRINVILGYARAAKSETDEPVVRANLETIIDQVSETHETVEKVVRIQGLANIEDEPKTMDVVPVLMNLIYEYERTTTADVDYSLPEQAWVSANPNLQRAFDEVVQNAIVHNDSESPRVTVSLETDSGGRGMTVVRIADDGPGMPEGTQDVLESPMVDPRNHLTSLGLWTAYWIVDRSNGLFTIEDNDPRGCVVRVELPTASAPD